MFGPGIAFLGRVIPRLLFPIFCTFFTLRMLKNLSGTSVPLSTPVLWILSVLSLPVFIALIVIQRSYVLKRRAKALGAVPAPSHIGKMIGSIDVMFDFMKMFNEGYIADMLWHLTDKYGPIINIRVFWQNEIFTTEPEHIKSILATNFPNYEKGQKFCFAMDSVLGTGVFNSDGDRWKFHRAMTRPFFSKDRISHFDIFERHADEAILLIKERLQADRAVDIQDVVSSFTLDSATEFLFGQCVHSLTAAREALRQPDIAKLDSSANISPARGFAAAFSDAQGIIAKRARLGNIWPMWEIMGDSTAKPMALVQEYLEPILTTAIERAKKQTPVDAAQSAWDKEGDVDDGETLLDHLVKHTQDPVILRDETLNILIAGRDTTASTLTFAMYMLATYPAVFTRLRDEILNKVGNSRRPTYEDIKEMKYLRAFINETLRLYPPVPFDVRCSIEEATLPPTQPGGKPTYVPPGIHVSYSVFMMHRRTDLWGPDALEFDPDRFLDERLHKYLTPNPFIFLPFNAGPRICLGQQFAYNEASFMLIRLLQSFDRVELAPEARPLDGRPPKEWQAAGGRQAIETIIPKTHLTLYVHKGMWLKLREANGL